MTAFAKSMSGPMIPPRIINCPASMKSGIAINGNESTAWTILPAIWIGSKPA